MAARGFEVVGVDIDQEKVKKINSKINRPCMKDDEHRQCPEHRQPGNTIVFVCAAASQKWRSSRHWAIG